MRPPSWVPRGNGKSFVVVFFLFLVAVPMALASRRNCVSRFLSPSLCGIVNDGCLSWCRDVIFRGATIRLRTGSVRDVRVLPH